MSTGSLSPSEAGPPARDELVGPHLTGRDLRHVEEPTPSVNLGPFRLETARETTEVEAAESFDELPWLEEPASESTAGFDLAEAEAEAEEPESDDVDSKIGHLADPWTSYLSIGLREQAPSSTESPSASAPESPPSTAEDPLPLERPEAISSIASSQLTEVEEGKSTTSTGAFPELRTDPRRLEEVAVRLEQIARALRDRGPSGALHDLPGDPLTALVTGYLLGFSEPHSERSPDSTG